MHWHPGVQGTEHTEVSMKGKVTELVNIIYHLFLEFFKGTL